MTDHKSGAEQRVVRGAYVARRSGEPAGQVDLGGGSLASAWREASPAIRRSSRILIMVGVTISAGGIAGDFYGYWSDKPFLTNLVSGTAGACFGISIALIVVRFLQDEQAKRYQESQRVAEVVAELKACLGEADDALNDLAEGQSLREALVKVGDAYRSNEAVRSDNVVAANYVVLMT
ncbi:hypothetical protein [Actinoplanes sp. NPDC049802]|uniref:hypothetical protein n=1 Tax=Actinoplanes sp. NPDC049802 TaxID=3154742 RepID=UPI0033CE8625